MIISRRLAPLPLRIPWAHQAQSNPTAPSDLAAAIVGGSMVLEWDAPAQDAASIPGTPRAGGTLTSDIPNIAGVDGLNHANFTCRWIPANAHSALNGMWGFGCLLPSSCAVPSAALRTCGHCRTILIGTVGGYVCAKLGSQLTDLEESVERGWSCQQPDRATGRIN